MSDYKQIVFLASYPKSGNTWVRCFLDAYFLQSVDINELLSSISDNKSVWHSIGDGSKIQDLPIEVQQLTRPMALLRLVRQYLSTDQSIPLFVKTHTPNMLINGIEMLPEVLTKATIFIVRDPRDVLPSYSKHMGVDLDTGLEWMQEKYRMLNKTDTTVCDFLGDWGAHTKSYLNADVHNVLFVKYEDLLEDPETMFTKILEHSGVEVDPERVKAAIELTRIDRLKKQEEKNGFVESSPKAKNEFFGKGGSANRDKLTPRQLHIIEKKYGSILKRLDYIKSKVA
jgi:hypothetical protein